VWRSLAAVEALRRYVYVCGGNSAESEGSVLPYCTKCGAPLKDDDRFCPVCGAAVAKVTREEYSVSGSNLVDRVRELLHEGNVTRVIVKDEGGRTLLEIPATVGVVGVVLAPWLTALGVIAALVANCRIVVERRE
jgi:exosome complex RNA-binding protein Csl4